MSKTSSFALRTFPEFKEAAQALASVGHLYETHLDADGAVLMSALDFSSINAAFNALIAKGLPSILAIVDRELAVREGSLEIAQEIMRFLLANPAARRAYATNFPENAPARRVIEASDTGRREAEDNEGAIAEAGQCLTAAEEALFEAIDDAEDGISRPTAASILASQQGHVVRLAEARGALQRALMTQGDAGARAPN